mmetsp:Transcript_16777/g.48714  ORF Transcript_16777/g.48714 Transcript_16777/m.48714 type:complete len:259 (-) Transcript_16777:436-1212(-)
MDRSIVQLVEHVRVGGFIVRSRALHRIILPDRLVREDGRLVASLCVCESLRLTSFHRGSDYLSIARTGTPAPPVMPLEDVKLANVEGGSRVDGANACERTLVRLGAKRRDGAIQRHQASCRGRHQQDGGHDAHDAQGAHAWTLAAPAMLISPSVGEEEGDGADHAEDEGPREQQHLLGHVSVADHRLPHPVQKRGQVGETLGNGIQVGASAKKLGAQPLDAMIGAGTQRRQARQLPCNIAELLCPHLALHLCNCRLLL